MIPHIKIEIGWVPAVDLCEMMAGVVAGVIDLLSTRVMWVF